jgi:hypothetical protein
MLQQIIVNTPVWVWALLAFLIYRGILSSVDREIALRNIFIIPVVMLGLSLQGIATAFGTDAAAASSWLVCTIAGTGLAWHLFRSDSIAAYPDRGVIFQQGSWAPLMLMLGIFFTKYAVAVMLALDSGHKQQALFVGAVCALYGLFNGVFIGKVLRIMSLYLRTQRHSGAALRAHLG